jgi:type I restriction enzyme S subunit
MNAARLLALYERIAEAPDAVARLRRFVLDLAVRGKLVAQDPSDDPASELLRDIGLRQPRGGEVALDFELPSGWESTTLGDVATITMGQSPPGETYNKAGEGVPLINGPVEFTPGPFGRTVVNQYTTSPTNFCNEGDLLICVRGSTTGRTNIAAFRACLGRGVAAIQPRMGGTFVRLFIWSAREAIIAMGRGIAFPSVSRRQLEELPFPLPPLAEQHRIVAKVDELMALCDRLEAARTEREAKRDRLASASLARLNTPDPETFPADASFALNTLPALTTRPDQIKALRQTILNLAVRGKLVPQDAGDEPATGVINEARAEIAAYTREHRITVAEAAPIAPEEQVFNVPNGWAWTRLASLFRVITDGDHLPPPRADVGVAFITIGNITTGKLDFSDCRLVPQSYFEALAPYRKPERGDILYTVVGATYGRAALVESDRPFCVQRHVAIMKPARAAHLDYLHLLLGSPFMYGQASRSLTGTAQPTIPLRPLRQFIAPIPPRAEQDRIVAKVNELMALCDALEASLGASTTARTRLLEATLAAALAPAEPLIMEAAQ